MSEDLGEKEAPSALTIPTQKLLTGEFSDLLRPEMDAHFYRPVKQQNERDNDHAEY